MSIFKNPFRRQPEEKLPVRFASVVRREEISIRMELGKAAYDLHEMAIRAISPFQPEVQEGDTFSLNWRFQVDYFGSVIEKLEAVQEICSDPDAIVGVSCNALEESRILIYEVLKQLDKVIQTVKARS